MSGHIVGRQICFGHFSRSDVPGVIEKRPRINYARRVHTFREQLVRFVAWRSSFSESRRLTGFRSVDVGGGFGLFGLDYTRQMDRFIEADVIYRLLRFVL